MQWFCLWLDIISISYVIHDIYRLPILALLEPSDQRSLLLLLNLSLLIAASSFFIYTINYVRQSFSITQQWLLCFTDDLKQTQDEQFQRKDTSSKNTTPPPQRCLRLSVKRDFKVRTSPQ